MVLSPVLVGFVQKRVTKSGHSVGGGQKFKKAWYQKFFKLLCCGGICSKDDDSKVNEILDNLRER